MYSMLQNLRPRKIILPKRNSKLNAKKPKLDNFATNIKRMRRNHKRLSSNMIKTKFKLGHVKSKIKVKSVNKKAQIKKSEIKVKTRKIVAALSSKKHTKVAAKNQSKIKRSQVKKTRAKLAKIGAGQNHKLVKNLRKGGTYKKGGKKYQNTGSQTSTSTSEDASKKTKYSCAICLNECIYPVKLPCSHIFCFLCAKGAVLHYGSCALCRQIVPHTFLNNPVRVGNKTFPKPSTDEFKWFYEGYMGGWWQYDDHSNDVIEEAFKNGREKCDVVIAGFVYEIDLKESFQRRKYEFSITRRIKRDISTTCKKGIAGLVMPPAKTPLMLLRLQ